VSTSGVRALAGALAIASVLMACTSEPRRDLPNVVISPGTTTSESPTLQPAEATVPPIEGRLAVIDGSGSLLSLEPDGSDAVVLAAGTSSVGLRQPAWSPDGRRLAWVRMEAAGQEVVSTLATSGPKGERPTRARARFAPFYLSWDPTSSRVAFLGSRRPSLIELGLVEVAGGRAGIRSLDAGQPYYFSWAPTGEEMLVHVGTDRLERLGLDRTRSTVGEVPGAFRAPAWSADGETMVYASLDGDVQSLIVRDVARGVTRKLLPFQGAISFVLSPAEARVAFQVSGDEGASEPLSVIDLTSGEVRAIGASPAAAFFWSPAGERLLSLVADPDGDVPWFRWHVWDGKSDFATTRFLPSPTFAQEYLPFFDQYAQSMTLWAPDGSAFAYPGLNEAGEAGIWVQEARANVAPVLVSDGGVLVTWSPASASG
jgi:TolB protein